MGIRIEQVELRASTGQVIEVRYGAKFIHLEKVPVKGIRAYYEYQEENEDVKVKKTVLAAVPGQKDDSIPFGPKEEAVLIGVLSGTFGPTFFYDMGTL